MMEALNDWRSERGCVVSRRPASIPARADSRSDRSIRISGPRVIACELLADGLRNANFKLRLDSLAESFVLRIYEHDATLCQKELDLMRLVSGSVPVPEVVAAEPNGWEGLPPFTLTRWVDGITFRDLKRSGDLGAIGEAARAAGETLAAIGRFEFSRPGWLGPGPTVTAPLLEGADAMPRFVELCLASETLRLRMPTELRDRTQALMWSWAPHLASLEGEARLVHGDFNRRNLLVRRAANGWAVAAVLDWEFALSGSPLVDLANFLRYEPAERPLAEPHFSEGYRRAGGQLPDDWRRLARVMDVVAICESLTHDDLPDPVIAELLGLLRTATEVSAQTHVSRPLQ
jgi:aminoglycoside phosphotransferase (APT) family kinase protein